MADRRIPADLPVAEAPSCIVMMGDDFAAPGGIATVVRHYREHGLFSLWPLVYFPTYRQPGMLPRLRQAVVALFKLLTACLRGRVILLHVHCASRGSFWRKAIYCALANAFGRPYIVHLHGGEFPEFFSQECGAIGRLIVRRTMLQAACVVALTEKWESWLRDTFPGVVVARIGNPVVVSVVPPPIRERGRTVLYLGRMYPEKGVLELIRAASLVCREFPDARFVLAGSATASFMAEMVALVAALELNTQVVFPGWITGAAKDRLLAECDVFVLPSYAEGLPLGLLEAMVAARAVVTTPVGGIPDVVRSGENGMLIPPRNVTALATALVSLLADEPRRRAMGEAARACVIETFSDQVVFAQIGEMYRKCGARPLKEDDGVSGSVSSGLIKGSAL